MRRDPAFSTTAGGGDPSTTATDRRAQVLRAANERAEERERQREQQRSPMLTPEERIRLWEQLHGLHLPRAANHKLLEVIATQTELSLQQVTMEQQRRAERRVPA
jgi:hypothetical protein